MRKQDKERGIRWLLSEKYNGRLGPAAIRRMSKDIKRLEQGEHIAYVIGYAPFLGVKVDLSEKPLIPRPETEFWVEQVISKMRQVKSDKAITARKSMSHVALSESPLRILDVFCGSGCIGLAVLKHVPQAQVTFADIEPRYFKGIRKSARLADILSHRFKTSYSDVLKNIRVGQKYDYILANPPYVPSIRKLPSSLKQEPQRALFGGKDGLRYIRELLHQAPEHLSPDGKLVIEFDSGQKTKIAALAKKRGYESEFRKDQYGKWRYAILSHAMPGHST